MLKRKDFMKSLSKTKSLQFFTCGLCASAILTVGNLYAVDGSLETPGNSPTTQGSGAARLSGNSEGASTTMGDTMNTTSSSDSSQRDSDQSSDAKAFLREAISGNSAEIALAEVAQRKSQNKDVKQFAEMIRKDHRQANEKIKPLAEAHGLTINQPLDSKHQKKLERFQSMSGAQFDKEYVTDMLKDHQKDIGKYEKAVENVKESDVKQYAQNTLPTLRQHLQHAEHAAQSIGMDQATITSILKQSNAVGGTADESEKATGSEKSHPDNSDSNMDIQQRVP
jgi:putative membrane protein